MNIRILKYIPALRLIDDGIVLDLFNQKVKKVESIILEELNHNLIGDLMVRIGLIVIPVALTQVEITYADSISKVAGIIIGALMFIVGIILLPETIRKLKDRKHKSRLELNNKGITLNNTNPYENGIFPWSNIDEITIKKFPNRFSGEAYLLFITNKDKLIDINLSLLKKRETKFLDKDEWLKTLRLKNENFEELIGCIQNYIDEKKHTHIKR